MISLRIKAVPAATLVLVAFAWGSGCSSGGEDDGSGGSSLTAGTTGSGASGGSSGSSNDLTAGTAGSGASGGSTDAAAAGGSNDSCNDLTSGTSGSGASGGSTGAAAAGGFGGLSTGGSTTAASGGGAGGGISAPLVELLCDDAGCQCENGVDDDGDGRIDGFDTECTGPFDDDEDSFATGISGYNTDPRWNDCFFDGNYGASDDQCRYHTDCLYGSKEPTDVDCTVSQQCINFCAARTQNGCDCFGCCEVNGPNGTRINVYLAETCSAANLSDEVACPRCEPSPQCRNACAECELCAGKTVEDLPSSCFPDCTQAGGSGPLEPPPYTCVEGTVCTATIGCASSEYCLQGCCKPVLR